MMKNLVVAVLMAVAAWVAAPYADLDPLKVAVFVGVATIISAVVVSPGRHYGPRF